MNARLTSASVDRERVTTLWETTPASVHRSTCRLMEETTAWVRLPVNLRYTLHSIGWPLESICVLQI